jgi:hypothetical protein
MRAYGIIKSAFWLRGSGKRLRGNPEAQVLALYLMTCSQGTMCGIFHVALPTVAHDTGIAMSRIAELLVMLNEIVAYDPDEELCWIPNAAREQVGTSLCAKDKKRPAVLRELKQFGHHPFVGEFFQLYLEPYLLEAEWSIWSRSQPKAPSKPLRSPFEAPSKPPVQDQDQDQDQDQVNADRPEFESGEPGKGFATPESSDSPKAQQRGTSAPESGIQSEAVERPRARRSPKPPKPKPERFVPDDWQPNETHLEKARELGVLIHVEVQRFRCYEFKTPKTDWNRAFHGWLARAGQFATSSGYRPAMPTGESREAQEARKAMEFLRNGTVTAEVV